MGQFEQLYREKLTTPENIAARLKNGDIVRSDIGASVPTALFHAICAYVKAHDVHDLAMELSQEMAPFGCYTDPEVMAKMKGISDFSSGYARKAVARGQADVFSYCYRDMPRVHVEYAPKGVFCATVAPMDEHGCFSFGTTASAVEAMLSDAQEVWLEVNPNMPRTFGGPIVHISQVDALCESDLPLPCIPPTVIDEKSAAIGAAIAEEIRDGATIQLGIGAIPDAVGMALRDRRHLGLHTELITASMIDLLECGAIDNSRKPIHRGKSVATFAFGAQKIYDYIRNNPSVLLLNVDYVNDIRTIARHPGMVSVNGAVQVDLLGQTSAESFGTRQISGTGGHTDFVRGAIESEGGKSFIALQSTTEDGVSRIQPVLEPGSIVTTGKNDVDYVVTEYGVAKLRGKTYGQKARALIQIAHPKFREELTFAARKRGLMV